METASNSKHNDPKRPTLFRRLTQWTIHWCKTPYAIPALCLVAFADSSFFPVPPDVLLIAMTFAHRDRWWRYAAIATVASLCGGILGWSIGYYLWHWIGPWVFTHVPSFHPEFFEKVKKLYDENAFVAILLAPFTFIPYKIFTISAGVFDVPLHTLLLASFLGRSARFLVVTLAIRIFGEKVHLFLEKYFKWVLVGLSVLVLVAIGVIEFFHHPPH